MQCTADFHHHIAHPVFPHPNGLFEHAAAFDTAIDMFDAHPSPRHLSVVLSLLEQQRFPAWLLRGLENIHTLQGEALKAQVLQPLTPRGQRIRGRIGYALVVDASRMGLAQALDAQRGTDQQEVFQHMPLFLPAIARFLFRRIVGARDGSFGAVMTKRGTASGVTPETAAAPAAVPGTAGHASPRHWRKASILRQGASPKVRKVFRSTGSKT